MITPVQTIAPAAFLTLPEVRAHLRIDHAHEDTLLQGYIAAAMGWLDGWRGVLGRCILTQTWSLRCDVLADMRLPFPDVQSAVVTYLDTAGATQTVAAENYRVRTIHGAGHLTFAEGYAAPAVQSGRDDAVTVSAVYGLAVAPAPFKVAALMLVAHWHANREGAGTDIPPAVTAMIAPWRVGLV